MVDHPLRQFFLGFNFYLAFSTKGNIRIGGAHAKPEFSTYAWFSMLFTAGIGSGTLFFSVVEPITYFMNPPIEGTIPERASNAMQWSFLHYGLHGWSIYILVGLTISFFAFN